MLWNSLTKNPVLALGILMFGLFLYQVAKQEKWGIFYNEKLVSTSCRGALVRLEKKIPANWRVSCEGNNLAVEIKEIAIPEKAPNLKALMYRQLANHMSFIAKMSQADILEKVLFVRFKIMHPQMEINAVTEGQYIVKLVTLETPEHIMTHLKSTVHVKETAK
jgi:hypothetical protein